jgi:hypothetical protein
MRLRSRCNTFRASQFKEEEMLCQTPRAARWFAAALLAAALGGCNDDEATSASAQAAPDKVTATWNRATALDVLANDSGSAATRSLAALVRAPANGTAAITDGRLLYTPRDGFYGSDSLRYAMRAEDNGATAEAEVTITVEAELALSGVAIDAPLADAAIAVSGAASAAATADAQGQWQATVRVSDPEAVLRIEARGVGTQQNVVLVSLAAASDIVDAADDEATVDITGSGALAVSHFTTALAALAERAAGGALATAAALRSAVAGVPPEDVLALATLIHLVADEGLALPEGITDTLALAQDATASAALLAAQLADSSTAAAFEQAKTRAIASAPANGDLPTEGVLVAYSGLPGTGGGVMFTFADDNTAVVSESRGTRSGRWARQDDAVVVTLDTPFSTMTFSGDLDPATGIQAEIRMDLTALRLRALPGGMVELATQQTTTYLTESRAGQTETTSALSDPGAALRLALDPASGAALPAADFEPGKRWSGVLSAFVDDFSAQDTLEITAHGTGRAIREGIVFTIETAGASFTLVGNDGSRREYLRLGDGPAGAVAFIVIDRSSSEVRTQWEHLLPPGDGFAFDATTATRIWLWDAPGITPQDTITLRPDGSSTYLGQPASWEVESEGRLRIVRSSSSSLQRRYSWLPLRRATDGSVWVMRVLVQFEDPANPVADNAPGARWTMLRYKDLGPAAN